MCMATLASTAASAVRFTSSLMLVSFTASVSSVTVSRTSSRTTTRAWRSLTVSSVAVFLGGVTSTVGTAFRWVRSTPIITSWYYNCRFILPIRSRSRPRSRVGSFPAPSRWIPSILTISRPFFINKQKK